MSDINKTASAEVEEIFAGEDMHTPTKMQPDKSKKSKSGKVILTVILVVILILVVLLIISKVTNWDILGVQNWGTKEAGTEEVVKASDWQAVFLTNGQVYFGKLNKANSDYPELEDIYYLQVQNVPIQPAEPATNEEGVQPAQQTEQRLILVKFGTELHRPMDKMYINKDHILMFEDLASDSNVVTAIENYKAGLQAPEVTQ